MPKARVAQTAGLMLRTAPMATGPPIMVEVEATEKF